MNGVDTVTWGVGVIAAILGGTAIIVPLFAKGWKKHVLPRMVSKATILKSLQELTVELKQLSCEMRPNGGSTVRDLLDRIERNQMVQGEKQRAIFTALPVGIFEADELGNVTWSNRKLSRMTGRTPSELRGSGWLNALQYDDRSRARANWARSIASESEYEEKVILQTPDGELSQVFIQSMKLETSDGEVLGYVVTVTEVEGDLPVGLH